MALIGWRELFALEHVSQVAPAAVAHNFYSPHPVADIDFRLRKTSSLAAQFPLC
jgi:hypothetical protein